MKLYTTQEKKEQTRQLLVLQFLHSLPILWKKKLLTTCKQPIRRNFWHSNLSYKLFNFFNNIISKLETKLLWKHQLRSISPFMCIHVRNQVFDVCGLNPPSFFPTHYYLSKENYGPKEKPSVGRLIFLWFRSFINKRKKVFVYFFLIWLFSCFLFTLEPPIF